MSSFKSWFLGAAVAFCAAAPAAHASPVTVDVYIYDGAAFGTNATAANAATAASHAVDHYEFTVASGLNGISWNNTAPQDPTTPPYNTGGQFLGSDLLSVTFDSCAGCGTEAQFAAQTLSVPGNNDGSGGGSAMFVLSGTAAGAILGGTITHDDGASFVWGNQTLMSSPGETTAVASSVSPAAFSTETPFDLYYMEGNGSPSVLDVNLRTLSFTSGVPEPSTWALMILGFAGVGFVAYRRKSKSQTFRFV